MSAGPPMKIRSQIVMAVGAPTILVLVVFVAALFGSKAGEIAGALGNVVGAVLGTIGAFIIALYTLHAQQKPETLDREVARQIVRDELQVALMMAGPKYKELNHGKKKGSVGYFTIFDISIFPIESFIDQRMPLYIWTADQYGLLKLVSEYGSEISEKKLRMISDEDAFSREIDMFIVLFEHYCKILLRAAIAVDLDDKYTEFLAIMINGPVESAES